MAKVIKLKNVRLSFPSLFSKAVFNGVEGKYEATFLLPKTEVAVYDEIMAEIEAVKKDGKIKTDKLCISDGDNSEYDGYAGNWAIKASNNKRPPVFNKDKSIVMEADEIVYAGCYVNANIDFWAQNNSFGKRVNSNLLGLQFKADGDSFEGSFVATDADFDEEDDF